MIEPNTMPMRLDGRPGWTDRPHPEAPDLAALPRPDDDAVDAARADAEAARVKASKLLAAADTATEKLQAAEIARNEARQERAGAWHAQIASQSGPNGLGDAIARLQAEAERQDRLAVELMLAEPYMQALSASQRLRRLARGLQVHLNGAIEKTTGMSPGLPAQVEPIIADSLLEAVFRAMETEASDGVGAREQTYGDAFRAFVEGADAMPDLVALLAPETLIDDDSVSR